MVNLLATLPVHLTLQLISSRNPENGVATLETLSSNQTLVVPDGYTAFPDIGVAYKYFSHKLTWDSARKHCVTEGGSLAVIDSLKKKDYALKSSLNNTGTMPWVGIHRLFNTVEWVSAKTGLPVAYVPWRPEGNVNTSTARCTAFWGDKEYGVGAWDCNKLLSSICEVPISKSTQIKISTVSMGRNEPHINRTMTARAAIPEGFTPFPHLGVAYKFIAKNTNWTEARMTCIANNSTLAVMDSVEKVKWAYPVYRSSNAWTGIHRLSGNSQWVNIKTGLPLLEIPWAPNSPSGDSGKDCLIILWKKEALTNWYCHGSGPLICEIPLPVDYN